MEINYKINWHNAKCNRVL